MGQVQSVLIVMAASFMVMAHCPNGCSGNGKCGSQDICDCYQNWTGADCSQRVCPFEFAFFDTALRDDDAHYYLECAGKGTCDRSTGICGCFDGYDGKGCQRSVCPNDCSGHGTCEFIDEAANDSEDRRLNGVDGLVYDETQWDWQKVQGCKCDAWFEGADCSQRMCPKGDDPLTVINKFVNQKQRISLYNPTLLTQTGTLKDGSGTALIYSPTNAAATANQVTMSADVSAVVYANDKLAVAGPATKPLCLNVNPQKLHYTVNDVATATVQMKEAIEDIPLAANNAGTCTALPVWHLLFNIPTETVTTVDGAAAAAATGDITGSLAVGDRYMVDGSSYIYIVSAITTGIVTADVPIVATSYGGTKSVDKIGASAPTAADSFFLTYFDPYGNMWNTTKITVPSATVQTDLATSIQTALRRLPNRVLDDVQVQYDASAVTVLGRYESDGGASGTKARILNAWDFLVTFMGTTGTSGDQHLLEVNGYTTDAGSFPVSGGFMGGNNAVVTNAGEHYKLGKIPYAGGFVSKEGTKGVFRTDDRTELAYCSNRGTCDTESGTCNCYTGFRGLACEFQEALV